MEHYGLLGMAVLLAAGAFQVAPAVVSAQRIVLPADAEAVVDAQRDLGAKGDGITDDTEALQRGLDISSGIGARQTKVLYLPNGVYRVTRTLTCNGGIGPWVYGESRDGVVIKLDDGVQGCTAVLRTHPRDADPGSADWFMRDLRNFTVDVGNNPDTDGIRYFATNTGILQNIRVTGHGKVGINAGFMQLSGPNLIQDVIVEGYETGILSQWIWGETLSRVTIRDCRRVGLVVIANTVAAEDLIVENTPQAVRCEIPNEWTWWGGVLALVGGRFSGGKANFPAIYNTGVLFARDVHTEGFMRALESATPGGNVDGADIDEYSSHFVRRLFEDSQERSLRLPIKREPVVAWETDPHKWVCANDFGAVAGDNQDDTAAIQAAIDHAAALGLTTVYLRGVGGPDPNWYTLSGEVRVHGSVRRVMGLGFGRVIASEGGRFVVGDDAAPVVEFRNIDSFGGRPAELVNRSRSSTVVAEGCGMVIVGDGAGDIFVTNCPAAVHLRWPGQKLWARHLNPEGDSDSGLVRNCGGDLWILGMKSEGHGVRVRTCDHGRTEVFGTFFYAPADIPEDEARPVFDIDNASACLIATREISFGPRTHPIKVRERRGEDVRTMGVQPDEHGWIGWPLYSGWR